VLISLVTAIFHPFIFSVIKSFQYLLMQKDGLRILITGSVCIFIVGLIPLGGELAVLTCTGSLLMLLFGGTKDPGLLATFLIGFVGSWTGLLFRYCIYF
jgi:hypothetical protein